MEVENQNSSLVRLSQDDCEFKSSLHYVARLSQRRKNKLALCVLLQTINFATFSIK